MSFQNPGYHAPDFGSAEFLGAPNAVLEACPMDGVPPKGFYLSTAFPEYFKVNGAWILPDVSVPFCCVVLQEDGFHFLEGGAVKKGDLVVIAHESDGSEGVYRNRNAFPEAEPLQQKLPFEESESEKYRYLTALMRHQKENGGHIVWVMGPAVVFNYDTRLALEALAKEGYVNAVLAGNALATHDLEGGYLNTALGQDIYTQEAMPNGHYNHLDTINECMRFSSIEDFVRSGEVKDGIMKVLAEENIPYLLTGSIRDDGPLPPVYKSMRESVSLMTEELKKATLVINLATLLHGVSAAGMVPGYRVVQGEVIPVFVYTIDITSYAEGSAAKVRHNFMAKSFITNVQDFVFTLKRSLVQSEKEATA